MPKLTPEKAQALAIAIEVDGVNKNQAYIDIINSEANKEEASKKIAALEKSPTYIEAKQNVVTAIQTGLEAERMKIQSKAMKLYSKTVDKVDRHVDSVDEGNYDEVNKAVNLVSKTIAAGMPTEQESADNGKGFEGIVI